MWAPNAIRMPALMFNQSKMVRIFGVFENAIAFSYIQKPQLLNTPKAHGF